MILKDIFDRQKESLEKNNLEASGIPGWMLRAIPVLGVAAGRWDVPALLAAGAAHAATDYLDLPRWLEWIYQTT